MDKILHHINKEIKEIAEQGLNSNNLEVLDKLVDIKKDIYEIEDLERGGGEMSYGNYMGYNDNREYDYMIRGGRGRGLEGAYGARNGGNSRGYGENYGYARGGNYGYRNDERIRQHLDRIMEGADYYQYGRDRYMDGGDGQRMEEGLEKLMYAVCVFVESMYEFAETPEEKEIIRKHVQKIKGM